ncbi:hypothetical protein CEY16_10710 [Halalkalibacillus sediminis]|uniref:Uncharacterized protein n=1 Tax=Halalkalibacillus sediminis TaxID=2018042 RepID=A0A2I0QS97_9BACI|nr:SE1832 family protein [Halalkalibacillus sediminis]PKR77203.1 hypothetical protein CEY16_10710 [Halalkalibacillus sediminis]
MNKAELEAELQHLKMDYIRIQGDVEKMESIGGRTIPIEQHLKRLEQEIADVRKKLQEAE